MSTAGAFRRTFILAFCAVLIMAAVYFYQAYLELEYLSSLVSIAR